MFQILANRLGNLALKAGKAGVCPACGDESEKSQSGEVLICSHCGFTGGVLEFYPNKDGGPEGAAGEKPADSRIVSRELSGGGKAFEIPAQKKIGCLGLFGMVWLLFIAFFTFAASRGEVTNESTGEKLSPIAGMFFTIPFWLVGLVLIYFSLKSAFARHLLLLENGTVVLVREFFGWKKTGSLPFAGIRSIENTVFYTQNYQPVYGVEIRGSGKKIRFGSALTDEEKGWLVAELRSFVFPKSNANASGSMRLGMPAEMLAYPVVRRERFELLLPPAPWKTGSLIFGNLLGLLMAGGFLAIGLSPLMKDAGMFRIIWVGLNSLFLLAIAAGIVAQMRAAKTRVRAVSDGQNLNVATERSGREIKREKIALDEIRRVALVSTGHENGEERWSGSVVTGDKLVHLFSWRNDPEAVEFVERLREKLDVPEFTQVRHSVI